MLNTQSGHHFMCGVRRIRVQHAFWTAYVADVTAIGDTNDTILGLVTIQLYAVILSFLSGT